jgi:L-fuculose-phosphate aldolase
MNAEEAALRASMLTAARKLVTLGLNRGTSGNLGVRWRDGFLVTPSGVAVEDMQPESMVTMSFSGNTIHSTTDNIKPSSEWRIHRDILAARPDIGAVVHTHSMFATTLACLHRDIPPFHYMIAVAGGDTIRCAPYARFGSQELSDAALTALEGRKACLLAHHGMLALGRDLNDALAVAEEVESLCEQYWRILQIGEPKLLSNAQMNDVLEQFRDYGRWDKNTENCDCEP